MAEAEESTERFTKLVDKDPSVLHERFAEWIADKTGYEDVDVKSVQMACALRIEFQKSPENQEVLAERRADSEKREAEREEKREAREAKKREEAEAKAKKAAAAKVKKAAPVEADEDEAEEPPAKPTSRRRRGTATTAKAKAAPVEEAEEEAEEPAAKPVSRRRRRPAAAAKAKPAPVEEDFDEDDLG
ncbi:hypothetical protein SEA_DRYAD_72 [Streptomyces phage Dryad]|nr:hypothetical protein SEA_DRYAD_72 [Streptomyces phage Dryad]